MYQNDSLSVAVVVILFPSIYLMSRAILGSPTYRLRHIPTVGGSSGLISSYFTSFRFYFYGRVLIQEGYENYPSSVFKIASMSRWWVFVSGRALIDDIRKATDDSMSFHGALPEHIQANYTIGEGVQKDCYHLQFSGPPLSKSLAEKDLDIHEEIISAFNDLFQNKQESVAAVLPATEIAAQTLLRATGRLFVGLPLCRNADYLQLGHTFLKNVLVFSQLLNMFPKILHPIMGLFVAIKVSRVVKLAERHIRPLAEDHIEQIMQGHKPNGTESSPLLTWLVDETLKSQRLLDFDDLSRRVLDMSFVAVGTMLATFPDVLINLAAYPEYVSPMREEVLAVTTKEGWTKSAVGKMHKVDSFIKETLRIGTGSSTGNRKIFKDFTLSNGVTLPAGTFVSIPTCAIHLDERHYHNSHEFQGFRFAETTVGERPDMTGTNLLVTLTPEFLAFGLGRHACPGRFFASYTLKVALAHVLLNFDVDFLDSSNTQATKFWFQALSIPYSTPELILRKRV